MVFIYCYQTKNQMQISRDRYVVVLYSNKKSILLDVPLICKISGLSGEGDDTSQKVLTSTMLVSLMAEI
jgi:hypothetical protein